MRCVQPFRNVRERCRRLAGTPRATPLSAAYEDPFPGVPLDGELPEGYGTPPHAPPSGRCAGIILHPTSLPGPYGIGEIGDEALRFVDWLVSAGVSVWQLLPLCPPETEYWSPYSGVDALCGNPLLIPIDDLVGMGLLDDQDRPPTIPVGDTGEGGSHYFGGLGGRVGGYGA